VTGGPASRRDRIRPCHVRAISSLSPDSWSA
jgi:hypothetical protein